MIADGSYVVTAVRPCALNQGPRDSGPSTPEPTTGPLVKDTGQ